MPHEAFTEDWARAWGERLRESAAYRESARTWEWPVALTLQADAAMGVPEDRTVVLDLFQGDCRSARLAAAGDLEQVPYLITAPASVWKQVLEGRLDVITGMMMGKVKLAKGSVGAMVGFIGAAKELVAAAGRIETSFPPGWV